MLNMLAKILIYKQIQTIIYQKLINHTEIELKHRVDVQIYNSFNI